MLIYKRIGGVFAGYCGNFIIICSNHFRDSYYTFFSLFLNFNYSDFIASSNNGYEIYMVLLLLFDCRTQEIKWKSPLFCFHLILYQGIKRRVNRRVRYSGVSSISPHPPCNLYWQSTYGTNKSLWNNYYFIVKQQP